MQEGVASIGQEPRPILGEVVAVAGPNLRVRLARGAPGGVQSAPMIGNAIIAPTSEGDSIALVYAIGRSDDGAEDVVLEAQLIGEIVPVADAAGRAFRRGVSRYPSIGALVSPAGNDAIELAFGAQGRVGVRLGALRINRAIPAMLDLDRLVGQHFAVLGSTGTGKSCTTAVLMRGLLESRPHAHLLMIDPHGEYGRVFGDRAVRFAIGNLDLPYWLLTFEESCAVFCPGEADASSATVNILRDAMLGAKLAWLGDRAANMPVTVDTPVPYRLQELRRRIDAAMGKLDRPDGTAPYRHLLTHLDRLTADQRFRFMFPAGLVVKDTMGKILGEFLRVPSEGRPVSILDISGIPDEVVDVVVSVLFRLVFEAAVWGDRLGLPPVLLICEEAHRYVSAAKQRFAPTREAVSRIAKEGRKYGVGLGLVSQRPSELDPSALSQCSTLISLRLTNERDQAFVRASLPEGATWLVDMLPALGRGEALVVGEAVNAPMVVHIDHLPAPVRPASRAKSYASEWGSDHAGAEVLTRLIDDWRAMTR